MDLLALQRSLAILEDRYRELSETGEKQFQAWKAEKDALQQQVKEQRGALEHIREIREKQVKRLGGLQSDLKTLQEERDAAFREQERAEQQLDQLSQELRSQADTLQEVQEIRSEQERRLSDLQSDLKTLQEERDAALREQERAQQQVDQLSEELKGQVTGLHQLRSIVSNSLAEVK